MSFQGSSENNDVATTGNGRNPLLIVGGFIILSMALALVIFGGNLFGASDNRVETVVTNSSDSILEQVPAFERDGAAVSVAPRR